MYDPEDDDDTEGEDSPQETMENYWLDEMDR